MCGFVALISPGVPLHEDLVTAMRDRLIHRGPDNGSNWIRDDRRVALAHRRLAIVDTSHTADQPMASDDGQLHITFNGEIYNYIELREELQREGVQFRTRSDTEVLLYALRQWGESALTKLNGMFAFALWDQRTERMLVVRDRFGEKPLFIGRGQFSTVVFASEMKAILAHPLIEPDIDREAVAMYGLGAWYEEGERTFFSKIERLPAAHAAWFAKDGAQLRRWRYWTPDYTQVNTRLSAHDAVEQFSHLLERSVRLRLRADVAVGSSLSGGLDSSVIVGMLSRERATASFTQNTFSACFPDDPTISEDKEIQAVVAHTGVQSFVVTPSPARLAQESRLLHWHQEEPFLSASIYLQWCVARSASEHNTTVLLDGQGADELLAGYQFYFRQRQLDLLDSGQRELADRETSKFNRRLHVAGSQYEASHRRFNTAIAYSNEELRSMRHPPSTVTGFPQYTTGTAPVVAGGRLRRTLSEALLYNSLPMLLRYADRNSMAFSREARLPYLDYDLVDFCLRLPDHYYIRHGWQKWILRFSAGKMIPPAIRWRADKVGYAAPLDLWLRNELREWGHERAMSGLLTGTPGYDAGGVAKLWAEHQAGAANHSWALWRWISLAEWMEMHRAGWWRARHPQLLVA